MLMTNRSNSLHNQSNYSQIYIENSAQRQIQEKFNSSNYINDDSQQYQFLQNKNFNNDLNLQQPPYDIDNHGSSYDHRTFVNESQMLSPMNNGRGGEDMQNLGVLIDWVNSFNDPYCLLVNSLNDLKDGIALCHLVGFITCTPSDQEKIKQLVYYDASLSLRNDLVLQNLDLALNILKNSQLPLPDQAIRLTSQIIQENDENLLIFLESMKQTHDIINYNSSPSLNDAQNYSQTPRQEKVMPPLQIHNESLFSAEGNTYRSQQHNMNKSPSGAGSYQPQYTSAYSNNNLKQQQLFNQTDQYSDIHTNSLMITPRNMPLQMQNSNNAQYFYNKQEQNQKGYALNLDNSLEINNISPIGQKNSVSPINLKAFNTIQSNLNDKEFVQQNIMNQHNIQSQQHYQSYQQPQYASAQPNHHQSVTKQFNTQTIIQKDPEELRLEQELQQLDQSYTNRQMKVQEQNQQSFANLSKNISLSHQNNDNKENEKHKQSIISSSSTRVMSMNTSASREKWKIKQLQNQNQDYNKIVKNSNQKMMSGSKTVDPSIANYMKNGQVKFNQSEHEKSTFIDENQNMNQSQYTEQQQTKQHKFVDTSINKNQQKSAENQTNLPLQQRQPIHISSKSQPNDDEAEEIMSEMQTLKILPESKEVGTTKHKQQTLLQQEITIDPVDTKTQYKILDWLIQDVKLLKHNDKLISELPFYCKNGVFFCDLINRLNGKHAIIKGIDRNPKNMTSIITNLNKILDYFRQFSKFNPRYLWAQKHIIDGNSDVIWGFLDDIWHWHFNKISPFDQTQKQLQEQQNQLKQSKSRSRDEIRSQNRYVQGKKDEPVIQSQNISHILPPRSSQNTNQTMDRRSFIDEQHVNLKNKHQLIGTQNTQRVGTPNILSKPPLTSHNESIQNFQSMLPREKSYGSLHLLKSPMTKNKKSQDLPLQSNGFRTTRQQSREDSQKHGQTGNNSFSRNNMMSSRKRRDISNINSPIARDQTGKLYYNNTLKSNAKNSDDGLNLLSINQRLLSNYEHLVMNDDMISEVRQWLFNLKFSSYLSREFEHKDICGDPFSNGVLLGELFSYLEKITLYKIIQYPTTILECKENVGKVLSLIRQRRRDFPSRLLSEQSLESILKRDKQTIYSILYYLKFSYPDAIPIENENQLNITNAAANCSTMSGAVNSHTQNLQLPYSQGEIRLLETSILNWIKSMGVLSKFGTQYNGVESLLEIQKEISNGSLLCEIVQTVFNLKITGIFKDPKTESSAISNIRKSLEVLRKQNKMSQKFTWAEKEINEGQMNIMIGLLEDLHRCFDGLAPRKRGPNYFSDGPYIGDTLYQVQPYLKHKIQYMNQQSTKESSLGKELSKLNQGNQGISTINQSIEFGGMTDRKFQEIPSILSYRQPHHFQQSKNQVGIQIPNISQNHERQGLSTLSPVSYHSQSQERKPNFGNFLNTKLQKETTEVQVLEKQLKTTTSLSPPSLSKSKSRFDDKNFNPFITKLKPTNLILEDYLENDLKEERQANIFSSNNIDSARDPRFNMPQQTQSNNYDKGAYPTLNSTKFAHNSNKINELVLPQKTDLTSQYPVAPTRSPLNVRSRGQSIEFDGGSHIKRPSMISIEDYENEEHNQNRNAFNQNEKNKIAQWLRESIGIQQIPKSFFSEKDPVLEFRDGILLSQIVGQLENHKFENIQMQPKSSASCLQNIKKALQLLKKKNQIPLYLLYSEEEIHNGNNEIIFQLLKSLRQAYKNKVKFQVQKK
eukprot:403347156